MHWKCVWRRSFFYIFIIVFNLHDLLVSERRVLKISNQNLGFIDFSQWSYYFPNIFWSFILSGYRSITIVFFIDFDQHRTSLLVPSNSVHFEFYFVSYQYHYTYFASVWLIHFSGMFLINKIYLDLYFKWIWVCAFGWLWTVCTYCDHYVIWSNFCHLMLYYFSYIFFPFFPWIYVAMKKFSSLNINYTYCKISFWLP